MNAAEVLNALAAESHDCGLRHGWYTSSLTTSDMLLMIHSEVSECCEAIRRGDPPSEKLPGVSQTQEELADVILRCLGMAAHMGWDIGAAVVAKQQYNWCRDWK